MHSDPSETESGIEMKRYYAERAPVYDRVYAYPERQSDLRRLEQLVANTFAGRDVLEVAAGTGYWTQFLSRSATSVLATDANIEALRQVSTRDCACPVDVVIADAYTLHGINRRFDGAFAGLWFSHVPIERREYWLAQLHRRLDTGAKVMFVDNSTAQCERLPINRQDTQGNTYQLRHTDAGNSFEVLKNFPSEEELMQLTADLGCMQNFELLTHFWTFTYEVAQ